MPIPFSHAHLQTLYFRIRRETPRADAFAELRTLLELELPPDVAQHTLIWLADEVRNDDDASPLIRGSAAAYVDAVLDSRRVTHTGTKAPAFGSDVRLVPSPLAVKKNVGPIPAHIAELAARVAEELAIYETKTTPRQKRIDAAAEHEVFGSESYA